MYIDENYLHLRNMDGFLGVVGFLGKDRILANRRGRLLSLIKRRFVLQKGQGIINIILPAKIEARLTLMAHYDIYFNSLGYNDNGSGVAVLLSMQDIVSDYIEIVFTDGEELMGIGSDYYFRHSKTRKLINIDVAGAGDFVCFERYSGFSDELPEDNFKCIERHNVPFSDCSIASKYNIPNLLVFSGTEGDDFIDIIWSLQHGNKYDNDLSLLSENSMKNTSDFVRQAVKKIKI